MTIKELDKKIALYQEAVTSLQAISERMRKVLHSKHPDPLLSQVIDDYECKVLGLTNRRALMIARTRNQQMKTT